MGSSLRIDMYHRRARVSGRGSYLLGDFFGRPPFLPFSRAAATFAGDVDRPPILPPTFPPFLPMPARYFLTASFILLLLPIGDFHAVVSSAGEPLRNRCVDDVQHGSATRPRYASSFSKFSPLYLALVSLSLVIELGHAMAPLSSTIITDQCSNHGRLCAGWAAARAWSMVAKSPTRMSLCFVPHCPKLSAMTRNFPRGALLSMSFVTLLPSALCCFHQLQNTQLRLLGIGTTVTT
jgi:hypothetical protein